MPKGPSVFNATTKHGATAYHGELYFYARNTVMNSNDWDNNYLQQTRPDGSYYYPGRNDRRAAVDSRHKVRAQQ